MKLSPLSVPYRAVRSISQLAWILVIATIGTAQVQSAGLGVGAGVILVAVLVVGVYQFVYYRRFDYRLTEDTLDIDSGVFSRRSREIPYRRIQNVDVRRNAVQRALGVAEVRVETAGGGETEVELQYVDAGVADELRAELSRRKRGRSQPEEAGAIDGTDTEAEQLYAVRPRELALLGVVNVDLRLLSAIAVLLPLVVPSVSRQFPLASLITTAPVLFAALVVLAIAVSSVTGIAAYWGFRLWRGSDELRYERGLVQQYAGTIPLEKIQTVRLSENVLARIAGYASVEVETAGYAPGESGGSQAAVPVAARDRAMALAREVEPLPDVEFERPPTRARLRYVARYTLVVVGLAALGAAAVRVAPDRIVTDLPVPGYAPLALLPLVPVAAHLKWRNLGYALLPDHVVTRAGFWTRTTHVIPYYRVQTIAESATIFQRRRDLATLVVDTAGSSGLTGRQPRAVDIEADRAADAREEIDDCLGEALAAGRERRHTALAGSGAD